MAISICTVGAQVIVSGNVCTAIEYSLTHYVDGGFQLELVFTRQIEVSGGQVCPIEIDNGRCIFGAFRAVSMTTSPSRFVNRDLEYTYRFDSVGELTFGDFGALSALREHPDWDVRTSGDWLTFADFLEDQGDHTCEHIRVLFS